VDRYERWILDVAVEARTPLRALVGPNVQAYFNRQHHGLEIPGVVEVLRRLLRQGSIGLFQGGGQPISDREAALRDLLHDDHERDPGTGAYYGLTSEGGAAWEAFAHPEWSRYIAASFDTEPAEAEVICADPDRLNGYVFSEYQMFQPLPGTVRRDRVEPWPATYWKGLLLGHRMRYEYKPDERIPEDCDARYLTQAVAWHKELSEWFTP
jgi:hypothetical protein